MPTFVLVGHCGPDSYLLKNAVQRAVPGAKIAASDDDRSLQKHLDGESVLLINRVLDGFKADNGIELIAELAKREPAPVMLLVSNYADAQAQAVAAGARPGFGKSSVYAAETARLLREAAGVESPA